MALAQATSFLQDIVQVNWKWVKAVVVVGRKSRTRNCLEISRPPEMAKPGPGPLSPLRVSWGSVFF